MKRINSMMSSSCVDTDVIGTDMAGEMKDLQSAVRKDLLITSLPVISARRCPILQDISGDIAQILSHSANTTPEETMNNLSNAADLNTLHVTRAEIFMYAIGCILESGGMDPSTLLKYKLKQRRGRNAKASVALDIARLFNYVCGVEEFPLCVLASNGLASAPLPGVSQNNLHHSLTPIPESSILGSADPPPHLSSTPLTPMSQDLPCAQMSGTRASSPALPSQTECDMNESLVRPQSFTCPLGTSAIDTSFSLSSISIPPTQSPVKVTHSPCCCDHGRAIIDLRCTVDVMQLELNKLQQQVIDYQAQLSRHRDAGGLAPCVGVDPAMVTLPSPPESRPPSVASQRQCDSQSTEASTFSTMDSFSEIFGLKSPPQISNCSTAADEIADFLGPQSNVTVRHGSVGSATNAVCDGPMSDSATPDNIQEDAFPARADLMHGEVELLRTQVHDLDDRLVAIEMASVTQQESLDSIKMFSKELKTSLQCDIHGVKQDVSKNTKRVKRLSLKSKKPHKKDSECEINVECSNRFSVLGKCPEINRGRANNHKNCAKKVSKVKKRKCPKDSMQKVRSNKSNPLSVKIIGASMVRGLGKLLNDPKGGIKACCYPSPGFTAEQIGERLPGMVSEQDDVVVLLGGTNNVPRDPVGTCVMKMNRLIDDTLKLNQRAHVVVSEIPIRFDEISLNEKIERLDIFIPHKCTKSERLHSINHSQMFRSDFGRDGLHLSDNGKAKFADATKRVIKALTFE